MTIFSVWYRNVAFEQKLYLIVDFHINEKIREWIIMNSNNKKKSFLMTRSQ